MLILMLVVGVVVVVALLYVVMHKRPVNNNVGLADPKSWHAQPASTTSSVSTSTEPEVYPGLMPPPASGSTGERPADQTW